MKKTKKVVYAMQCQSNPEHILEKVIEIEEGSEKFETEITAYCPKCKEYVKASVQGKLAPDQDILRKFESD